MLTFSRNRNLTLYQQPTYQGMPIQTHRGPLILEYLDKTLQIINTSLNQYGRVFAFRLDLRFPSGIPASHTDSNLVMERFIASFKAKIKHNRDKAKLVNPYAHDTTVHYVWCREIGLNGTPHYHMAILLNNDAFCTLGKFEMERNNLFNRLHEAWASALGVNIESVVGLVELPNNPFYQLRRDDPESVAAFFYRVSYLCKADTKVFGDGIHAFGASRL